MTPGVEARYTLAGGCVLVVQDGDITAVRTDAIVDAANERMLGGGGVDGAIHRAAGPELRAACEAVPEVRPGVRCPTGEARVTPAFRLPTRRVIHTVGPVYRSAEASAPLLRAAYRSSLEAEKGSGVFCRNGPKGAEHKRLLTPFPPLDSIAFPAISCGVYGYPLDEAAEVSIRTCLEHAGSLAEIRFVLFGQQAYEVWCRTAQRLVGLARSG